MNTTLDASTTTDAVLRARHSFEESHQGYGPETFGLSDVYMASDGYTYFLQSANDEKKVEHTIRWRNRYNTAMKTSIGLAIIFIACGFCTATDPFSSDISFWMSLWAFGGSVLVMLWSMARLLTLQQTLSFRYERVRFDSKDDAPHIYTFMAEH